VSIVIRVLRWRARKAKNRSKQGAARPSELDLGRAQEIEETERVEIVTRNGGGLVESVGKCSRDRITT